MKNLFYPLLIIYIIEFIILGINPIDRLNWYAENITMLIIVLSLFFTYKKFQFSNISYLIIFVLIYIHTIWWHYTFANVPFDFVTNFFWFKRNNFDRVAHFTVWFYAYPFVEILKELYKIKQKFILFFFPLFFIMAVAAMYEIVEWWFASLVDPAAWMAFLGSQWDIWDAQADMLADTIWALFTLVVYFWVMRKSIKKGI